MSVITLAENIREIILSINPKKDSKINQEIELRLGDFKNISSKGRIQFIPGVQLSMFERLKSKNSYIENNVESNEETLVCFNNQELQSIRYVVDLKTDKMRTELKNRIRHKDLPEVGMRLSYSEEMEVEKDDPRATGDINTFRYRKRESYISKNRDWRFDLTRTCMMPEQSRKLLQEDDVKNWLKTLRDSTIDEKEKNFVYEIEIEYVGRPVFGKALSNKIIDVVTNTMDILTLTNDDNSTYESNKILKFIQGSLNHNPFNLRKLINKQARDIYMNDLTHQPVNISRNEIVYRQNELSVTDKADGHRYLMYIPAESESILMSTRKNIVSTGLVVENSEHGNTILDGEYLGESNSNDFRFLAFDILIYAGKDVTEMSLIERRKLLLKFSKGFNVQKGKVGLKFGVKNFLIAGVDIGPSKQYTDLFKACASILDAKFDYPLDGLIMYSPGHYRSDTFKWKGNETNSIDLLVSWNPNLDLTRFRENDYIPVTVSVSIKRADFQTNRWIKIPKGYREMFPDDNVSNWTFSIPFIQEKYPNLYETSIQLKRIERKDGDIKLFVESLDGVELELKNKGIYEMLYFKNSESQWRIMRHRYDKQYPNGFVTASNIWNTITLPITKKMITGKESIPSSYFIGTAKTSLIEGQKKVHSFVKSVMYQMLPENSKLLELGVGRGSDLLKWIHSKVSDVVGIDVDNDALEELQERYNNQLEKKLSSRNMRMSLLKGDIEKPDNLIGESVIPLSKNEFDCVACQFAIMYFTKSVDLVNKYLDMVDSNLKTGGMFMFTTLDGGKVMELFNNFKVEKDSKFTWVKEGSDGEPVTIYSLKKNFEGDVLLDVNQKIMSYVESIGSHMEYLVNCEYIISELERRGYTVLVNNSFDTYVDEWKQNLEADNKPIPLLDKSEYEWINLQRCIVVRKDSSTEQVKVRKRRKKTISSKKTEDEKEPKVLKKRGRKPKNYVPPEDENKAE